MYTFFLKAKAWTLNYLALSARTVEYSVETNELWLIEK